MAIETLSDAELTRRCRERDREAWDELVQRFYPYVYAIAVRVYSLDAPTAEDVFQEVFARAYEHLDDLRSDGSIRLWIAQVTRRAALATLRASNRERPGQEPVEDLDEAAHVEIERLDEALAVQAAMAQLPHHSREILDRFFCRDQSYRTISAALDLPAGTVASRISRALRALRDELEPAAGAADRDESAEVEAHQARAVTAAP